MDLPDFLKKNSQMVPPGADPLAMPTHRGGHGPNKLLLALLVVGMCAFCGLGFYGLINRSGNAMANPSTATEVGAGLPNPNVAIQNASATPLPTATKITGAGILTQLAVSPFAMITSSETAENFLTQQMHDDLNVSATYEAAEVGTIINQANPFGVTTVYVYPTAYPSPFIVTASPTWTPVVITATQGPTQTPVYHVITATPGPTQTPWFYITQPPVVTVMWTREVEVTRLVTVVVTATETETLPPSETPVPAETPTETPTEIPTP